MRAAISKAKGEQDCTRDGCTGVCSCHVYFMSVQCHDLCPVGMTTEEYAEHYTNPRARVGDPDPEKIRQDSLVSLTRSRECACGDSGHAPGSWCRTCNSCVDCCKYWRGEHQNKRGGGV